MLSYSYIPHYQSVKTTAVHGWPDISLQKPTGTDLTSSNILGDFVIGFWHPFGIHAGEMREEIINRKLQEIDTTGWTLWSFQFKRNLRVWFEYLNDVQPQCPIYVLCADSKFAKYPKSQIANCTEYVKVDQDEWQQIPATISVPHPMASRELASAFIVNSISVISGQEMPRWGISWFCVGQQLWRNDNLPTRGEYLIRREGEAALRPVCAILELRYPYLAVLRR